MSVDPEIARWFREGILYASAEDAATAARWGGIAITSSIDSALALKADAQAEAIRQLAIWSGPIGQDEHLVAGDRKDLKLRCITLVIDRLGYDEGVPAFVLGTEPAEGNMTRLTVIRRL